VGDRDPPATIGVRDDVGECGVELQITQHSGLAEVVTGAVHRRQPRGQQAVVQLKARSRRYAEHHLVHAVLTDAEIRVRTETEGCCVGPHVAGDGRHDQT